jgi:hypothetical protein
LENIEAGSGTKIDDSLPLEGLLSCDHFMTSNCGEEKREETRTHCFQTCYGEWISAADAEIRSFWDAGEIFGGVAEGFGDFFDMFCILECIFSSKRRVVIVHYLGGDGCHFEWQI